jgi:hypothetical protein
MASSTRRSFFGAFEGTRSAYPIAIVRIAFFGGLALHFFPSLLYLDESYTPGALRSEQWNHWLYVEVNYVPHAAIRALSILTMLACIMAIVGFKSRLAMIVSGLGFYTFASINAFPVQTLALVDAWGVLLLFMIFGAGEALSVDSLLSRSKAGADPPRAPRLLSGLVLFQVLLAVFFSGIEKLLAGWPWTNEMATLLAYPRGLILRDWVVSSDGVPSSLLSHAFTWGTLVVELGAPIVLVLGPPRARLVALVVYEAFFIGIISMLAVPPLFVCIYPFGGLLVLDDDQVAWVVARLTRSRGIAPA